MFRQRDAGQYIQIALSCDTAVALGDATTDGAVLLAKNSDRRPDEAQRLIGVPAARHGDGETLRCQYLTIPQAPRTAALIGSQPYWLWGFEHGLNEHGVAIGNEALHTRETPCESGLLGMDLLRLGLERGTTAREALECITALLEHFGQGGSAEHHFARYYDNAFLIADPREAWVLETSGRHWAARRLTRGAYAISNKPTITTEYDLASHDLISYAEERGWWPRGRRPFSFAAAYADLDDPGWAGASCRMARSLAHLTAGHDRGVTVPDMMALLRDHGPAPTGGAEWLAWPSGAEPATVCMHGPEAATAASVVARLAPGAAPTYWASLAPPCGGVFLPCWVETGPPVALAHADETPDPASPWWRYRRLWEAVAAAPDPGAAVAQVRSAWSALEDSLQKRVAALGPDATTGERRAFTDAAWSEAQQILAALEDQFVTAAAR